MIKKLLIPSILVFLFLGIQEARAADTVIFVTSTASTTAQGAKSVFTADQVVTATTTASYVAINGSSTFTIGDIFRFITSAASSTQFMFTMSYQALP